MCWMCSPLPPDFSASMPVCRPSHRFVCPPARRLFRCISACFLPSAVIGMRSKTIRAWDAYATWWLVGSQCKRSESDEKVHGSLGARASAHQRKSITIAESVNDCAHRCSITAALVSMTALSAENRLRKQDAYHASQCLAGSSRVLLFRQPRSEWSPSCP